MRNAKEEFINAIGKSIVKCAVIHYSPCSLWETPPEPKGILLKQNYTAEDYTAFVNQLDFDYDNGYGGQELYGTVWLTDGNWLTRGEYDGKEWWDYNSLPEIPKELI
jgi:hypothetical protein